MCDKSEKNGEIANDSKSNTFYALFSFGEKRCVIICGKIMIYTNLICSLISILKNLLFLFILATMTSSYRKKINKQFVLRG